MESNDRDYSHLPEAVRREAEEADAMMDALMKENSNTQDDQDGKTASGAEQGVEGQAAGDQSSAAESENQSSNASDVKPDGVENGAKKEEEETFRKRYEVLAGKYGAEVPRLHQQINELNKRVADLSAALAAQGRSPESAPERKADQQPAKTPKIDPKKLADFGEDFESVGEIVNTLSDKLEALERENQTMRQALGGVQQYTAQSAEERFASGLSTEVPNWRQINDDPLFWEFLNQTNPYTGQPMRDAINDASNKRDAGRAAFIFKQFLAQSGAAPSTQQGQNGQSSQGKSMDRQAKLERELSPGKSKSGAAPQSTGHRNWTTESAAEFYEKWARGQIPEEQAEALEKDLRAFMNESKGQ